MKTAQQQKEMLHEALNRRLNQLYSIMHPLLSSDHWSDYLLLIQESERLIQCLPASQHVCLKCHG